MLDLQEFYQVLRRIYIMWQAHKWSVAARRAIRNYDPQGTRVALAEYAKLNDML